MHFVTPRGTQCDTLCIIASIFLLIFATESREKGQLCLQMAILSCTFEHFNVVQKACATGLKKPLLQDSLKWAITKAYTEALLNEIQAPLACIR